MIWPLHYTRKISLIQLRKKIAKIFVKFSNSWKFWDPGKTIFGKIWCIAGLFFGMGGHFTILPIADCSKLLYIVSKLW